MAGWDISGTRLHFGRPGWVNAGKIAYLYGHKHALDMRVTVYGNEFISQYAGQLKRLLDLLTQAGAEVAVEAGFYGHLSQCPGFAPGSYALADAGGAPASLALSVGGDGTFLRAAQMVGDSGTPILGVNTGHLGYLAAADLSDPERVAQTILAGGYEIERRTLLRVDTDADSVEIPSPYALNEVAIMRQDTSLMISMHTWVNGCELTTYRGDGLIISTPTGSTAYNLSVGGPILDPASRCIVLSPVSVHSLTMRPLVIDDDSVVRVATTSRAPRYRISVDGRPVTLPCGAAITVGKAPFHLNVAKVSGRNFTHTLREKLMWGIDGGK